MKVFVGSGVIDCKERKSSMKTSISLFCRLGIVILCITAFSGCNYCLEREMVIDLTDNVRISGANQSGSTVVDLNSSEILEELILQGWKIGLVTVPVGEDCKFSQSVRDLEEMLNNPFDVIDSPLAPLLRILPFRGRIKSMVLQEIVMEPTVGNFASIDRISFNAATPTQGTINSYSATGPFEGTPVLTPDRNIDLYSVISKGNVECINGEITLRGDRPASDLIFSARGKAVYEVKIGLF